MYFTRPDQLIINPVGMIVLHSWETNSYVDAQRFLGI